MEGWTRFSEPLTKERADKNRLGIFLTTIRVHFAGLISNYIDYGDIGSEIAASKIKFEDGKKMKRIFVTLMNRKGVLIIVLNYVLNRDLFVTLAIIKFGKILRDEKIFFTIRFEGTLLVFNFQYF